MSKRPRAALKGSTAIPSSVLPPPGTPPERMATVTDLDSQPPAAPPPPEAPVPRYALYITMWYRKRDGGTGYDATTVMDLPNVTKAQQLGGLKAQIMAGNPDLVELVILDWKSMEG